MEYTLLHFYFLLNRNFSVDMCLSFTIYKKRQFSIKQIRIWRKFLSEFLYRVFTKKKLCLYLFTVLHRKRKKNQFVKINLTKCKNLHNSVHISLTSYTSLIFFKGLIYLEKVNLLLTHLTNCNNIKMSNKFKKKKVN